MIKGEKINCPNCKKDLTSKCYPHAGWGAGHGEVRTTRYLCHKCKKGCTLDTYDDIPGFKEHTIYNCCKCGYDSEKEN